MADMYDYSRQLAGCFQAPPDPDHEGGLYIDERRCMGLGVANPRSVPYPDRVPRPDELACGGGAPRETFRGAIAYDPRYRQAEESPADRYARGSYELGHGGGRRMVTSSRAGRPAVDATGRGKLMVQPPLAEAQPGCARLGRAEPADAGTRSGTLEAFAGGVSQALACPDTLKMVCLFLLLVIVAMILSRPPRWVGATKTVFIVAPGATAPPDSGGTPRAAAQ